MVSELQIAECRQDVAGKVLQSNIETRGPARQTKAVFGVAFKIVNDIEVSDEVRQQYSRATRKRMLRLKV